LVASNAPIRLLAVGRLKRLILAFDVLVNAVFTMSIVTILRRHTEFIRNVATLLTGSVAARAIGLIFLPVVAWLYDPVDFGVAALFVATVSVLSTISSFCYERAIVLPKDDADATGLTILAVILAIFFGVVLLLLLGLYVYAGNGLLWLDQLGVWALLVPLAILAMGAGNILRSHAVRRKRFRNVALSEVALVSMMSGSRIGAGWMYGSSVGALVVGYILGILSRVGALYAISEARPSVSVDGNMVRSVVGVAKRYSNFFRYTTPTTFIKSLSENLPLFLLGYLFTPEVVGFYALANRLVSTPVTMVSQSIRQVYLQKVAEVVNENRSVLGPLMKTTIVLVVAGAPLFVGMFFYGEEVLQLILGEKWVDAGRYVEILAPWLFAVLVVTPSSAMFVVLGKQAVLFYAQLGMGLARVVVFLVAYVAKLTPEETLGLVTLVGVGGNIFIVIKAAGSTKVALP